MGAIPAQFLRRARIRSIAEGKVQTARVEVFDHNGRDSAERWQDYGFAANPVAGEGLVMQVGGHTIIMRCDRIGERPQLAAYEVSVWHREGHCLTLGDGRRVHIANAAEVTVDAGTKVLLNTPVVECSKDLVVGGNSLIKGGQHVVGESTGDGNFSTKGSMHGAGGVSSGSTDLDGHDHGGVERGGSRTNPAAG